MTSLRSSEGTQVVRDVWRQMDLGEFETEYKAPVPRRGVVLLRLTSANAPAR